MVFAFEIAFAFAVMPFLLVSALYLLASPFAICYAIYCKFAKKTV